MHGALKCVAVLGTIGSLLVSGRAVPASSGPRSVEPAVLAAAIRATESQRFLVVESGFRDGKSPIPTPALVSDQYIAPDAEESLPRKIHVGRRSYGTTIIIGRHSWYYAGPILHRFLPSTGGRNLWYIKYSLFRPLSEVGSARQFTEVNSTFTFHGRHIYGTVTVAHGLVERVAITHASSALNGALQWQFSLAIYLRPPHIAPIVSPPDSAVAHVYG